MSLSLLEEMNQKASDSGVAISVHLDITWRCNERCVHCYLDHDGKGEMTTDEIKNLLREVAECGTFFLSISGGEPLLRRDCFEILEYARALRFNVKLKTNAVMIGPREAERIKKLGIEQVQISLYSHRPEVHDAITKLPGSLRRTINGIRLLKENGVKVSLTNVLMKFNNRDTKAVKQLAKDLGVNYVVDPTITPMLSGDRAVVNLGLSGKELEEFFRSQELMEDMTEGCLPVSDVVDDEYLEGYSCSAGHTLAYISPFGDVYPCVQFPMPCGSVRKQSFRDIWYKSSAFTELRDVHIRDLHTCSTCSHTTQCTRCPGLAYIQGDMRGPSYQDCEKSYARTGVPSAAMLLNGGQLPVATSAGLVQIAGI